MVSNTDSQWKRGMRSGRHSQTCGLFARMGSGVAPEGIKQRSRRCCSRWVGRSWSRLCLCMCVWAGRWGDCTQMCIYGGGGHGNARDELMTICPLRCPWGLGDRGTSQVELDTCHSRQGSDGGGDGGAGGVWDKVVRGLHSALASWEP